MKYDPNRNYLYPVLRPHSDDYPGGELRSEVSAEVRGPDALIGVKFDPTDASVRQQVKDGNARCAAMLYCRETLHRETLRARKGDFALDAAIPARILVGDVEVHPIIIAVKDIDHSTKTAHPEYGGAVARIGKRQPLATAQTWRFRMNADERHTQSVFNLTTDNELPSDVFDIRIDPKERYIDIVANDETRGRFDNVRKNLTLTRSSVYMSALIEALARIKNDGGDGDEASGGWVDCIQSNLRKHGIEIGDRETAGSHSLLRAAQLLLEKPFGDLIDAELSQSDDGENEPEDD